MGVSAVEQGLARWMLAHPHHQLQGAAQTALPALHVQGFTAHVRVVLIALGYQQAAHSQEFTGSKITSLLSLSTTSAFT